MSVVRLPKKTCDHQNLVEAIVESGLAEAQDFEIKVEFQSDTFITTSALAQLCSWGLLRREHGCTFRFLGEPKALSYPGRVGLFKHLGFDYPEPKRLEDEGERFIPLRLLSDRDSALAEAVKAVRDLVSLHVDGSDNFLPALQWVVHELTDNVGNHAESLTPGVLCAQLYPRKKRVEIAIADMGRGIKASLAPRYPKLWSHGDAITKAMEPGVTRDLAAGQGNGLSGSHEIIMANGGELNVWTGGTDLAFGRGKKKGFRVGPEFPGTGILISLRTNHPVDLRATTIVDATERNLHEIRRTLPGTPMPNLLVAQLCSHVGGRGPGKTLRDQIETETGVSGPAPQPVVLDFEGVDQPSSSFLDEVFGRFADQHGREQYERLLELRNAGDIIPGMIAKVVSQRLNSKTDKHVAATYEPPPQLRGVLDKVCPAKAAIFVGIADSEPLEKWWTALLGRAEDTFHPLALGPGWADSVSSKLESLEDPVLLLPAWETNRELDADLLLGHSSVASALVSIVAQFVADGRPVYVLVPTALVSSQRDVALRNELWSHDILRTVVGFSANHAGFSGIHHSFSVTLLHLAGPRPNEQDHAVAMIDGDKLATAGKLSKSQTKELARLLGAFGSGDEFGYRFTWDDPASPLRYESHDPKLRMHKEELEAVGGTVSLSQLMESSWRGSAGDARFNVADEAKSPFRVISAREIRGLQGLSREDLNELELPASVGVDNRLESGDVLVCAIWDRVGRLGIGVVSESLEGAVAGTNVFVLRFADNEMSNYVLDFLRSESARRWLQAEVSGIHIPLAKLHELPLPAPGGRIANLVRHLSRTSAELRRVADEFDAQRRSLFGIQSPREQVAKSEETSMLATTLDRGIRALGDQSERIRLLFPLPLALSWRIMELEERPRERYDAMLHVFEATVCYLSAMLVASLRAEAAELEVVPKLLEAFRTPGRGPTLGDWVQLLRQAPKLEVAEALDSSPFPELRVLLSGDSEGSEWWKTAQALLDRRNDLAHRRGPQSDGQFEEACISAQEELSLLFSHLAFLTRYQLTLVMECAFDELEGSRTARVKELAGDHSVVPVKEIPCGRELGGGLYFSDARGDLTLCSPWMEYAECPKCGNWEVTIPEYGSHEDAGATCYKGLRNGHIHSGSPGSHARLARFVGSEESR